MRGAQIRRCEVRGILVSLDKLFGALKYHCLLSRYVAHSEERRSGKTKEVMETKSKFPRKQPNIMSNFNHCWRNSISQFCRADLEFSLLSYDISASINVLSVFGLVHAVDVLHEYIGSISQVVYMSEGASTHMDGTILTLACMDAFISMAVYRFCDDGVGKVRSD